MRYRCTKDTGIDELVGHDSEAGYCYGPVCDAMRSNEELVLESSADLSVLTVAKLQLFMHGVFIPETGENIEALEGFRLVLH